MSVQPPAVLSCSLQYGIVSRSLPLTGKILRGYLDASGTGLGVGNNNPNVEFTPNVSACAMSSDGGTAKIIWGFRSGEIALMTAQKAVAMDGGGRAGATAAKLVRCEVEDEHDGAVLDIVWQSAGWFVTSSADGRAKLWDAKNVRCVWTSEKKEHVLVVDPIVRVTCGSSGKDVVIVGATSSGDIVVYAGFGFFPVQDAPKTPSVTELRIPFTTLAGTSLIDPSHEISALHITPSSSDVLVGYKAHPFFYRLEISLSSGSFDQIKYSNISTPICAIFPSFAEKEGEKSFVITGDQLGDVSIYSWDPSPNRPHNVIHKFSAHTSPITALAYSPNSVALITGSVDGEVKFWDSLSFVPIRSFTFSAPRRFGVTVSEYDGINQIVVQKEMVVATAGERVLAWRAGSVGKDGSHHRPMSKSVGMRSKRQKGNKYRRACFLSALCSPKLTFF
jgi:WD40 repeat protein